MRRRRLVQLLQELPPLKAQMRRHPMGLRLLPLLRQARQTCRRPLLVVRRAKRQAMGLLRRVQRRRCPYLWGPQNCKLELYCYYNPQ